MNLQRSNRKNGPVRVVNGPERQAIIDDIFSRHRTEDVSLKTIPSQETQKIFYDFSRREIPLTVSQKSQAETKDWVRRLTRDWKDTVAATFHLKQQRFERAERRFLNEAECRKAFRFFLKRLNKQTFKGMSNAKRLGVKVIAVLEYTDAAGWHIHAIFERPSHLAFPSFRYALERCWQRVGWAERVGDIKSKANAGWVDYIFKAQQKTKFETWFDCIDLDTLRAH